jgi:hypothetical protein
MIDPVITTEEKNGRYVKMREKIVNVSQPSTLVAAQTVITFNIHHNQQSRDCLGSKAHVSAHRPCSPRSQTCTQVLVCHFAHHSHPRHWLCSQGTSLVRGAGGTGCDRSLHKLLLP